MIPLLGVCLLLGGCQERTDVADAYDVYATSDTYQLTESSTEKSISLLGQDLCVGGTENTAAADGIDTDYAQSAAVFSVQDEEITYAQNIYQRMYPASTTKIMTLLVAIENSSPKDIVTFTETGIRDVTWDSSNINAQLGETMTMKDCWMAAYIKSANEVCAQIAETVGGTEANFVEMMNQKAKELGCTHTHFANASGLPDENHYSSAHDLAKIMRACLRNKRFRQVMKCSNYKIPATNLSEARVMHTHMPLMAKESNLYYADCIGGKTGFSTDAQHTLVTAAERNGRTYIAVTMRAADLGINCTDSIR